MQAHNIKRNIQNKKRTIVGRGGKRGKTSGRGTKGQNARAGRKKRPELRDIIKTLPKLRGRGVHGGKSIQDDCVVINLDQIEKHFSANTVITPRILVDKGLVKMRGGDYPSIKILGKGALGKKITLEGCRVSLSAKAMIEKAGGMVK